MNKKGFTLLDVIVSIVIIGVIVTIVTGFKAYLVNHETKILKQETFYSHIDTELTKLYSEDWNYETKTIDTDKGEMQVTIENLGESEYNTNMIQVTFEAEDLQETYQIERSEYYE